MTILHHTPLLLLLLLLSTNSPSSPTFVSGSGEEDQSQSQSSSSSSSSPLSPESQGCGLYLAPSTSSPHLGMYAGADLPPSTPIGTPDLAIPLIDMDLHNGRPKNYVPEGYFDRQKGFFWHPGVVGANYEGIAYGKDSDEVRFGGGGVDVAIPGVGSLGNDHPGVSNADWDGESVLARSLSKGKAVDDDDNADDDDNDDEEEYATRGSYTTYFNVTLRSTRFIPAGMQIFQNLGESQRHESRYSSPSTLKPVDYEDADLLLKKIRGFLHDHRHSLTTDRQKRDLYKFFTDDVLKIVGTKGWNDDPDRNKDESFIAAILALFPEDPDDIDGVLARGGTFVASHPETIKPIEWLEEEGQCLDNLAPETSTIRNAGHGAFATRDIPSGALVAPAPLLVIDDVKYLDMYRTKLEPSESDRRMFVSRANGNKVVHRQLMLNYCYKHPQSSLLFFAYGMGVNFINHSADGANAEIVWTNKSYHRSRLLSLTPKQLLKDDDAHLGLGFDIVATRPISAGEEVFLDYGPEWVRSWDAHLRNGRYPRSWPVRALDLNAADPDPNSVIYTLDERERTVSEGDPDPYDDSRVMTACHYASETLDENDPSPRKVDGIDVYRFPKDEDLGKTVSSLHACRVTERKEEEEGVYSYTVLFLPEGESGEVVVKGLPRRAIVFLDQPYKGDMHVAKTFRSPIGIPDGIFPEAWKDLK